jgi:hypothetical protein
MYNSDFTSARTELKKAFEMCHTDYLQNKQRILRYLIPVEMNTGKFPSQRLLQMYDLNEYSAMVDACLNGDMPAFEAALEQNMDQLIYSGVFTTVEHLRLVTLKNFVKRVASAVRSTPELQLNGKPSMISLNLLFKPLQAWDSELDLDELECLLATLMGN